MVQDVAAEAKGKPESEVKAAAEAATKKQTNEKAIEAARVANEKEAPAAAQAVGDIVFEGQPSGAPQAEYMGAYELVADKVVNGRAGWTLSSLEGALLPKGSALVVQKAKTGE